MKTNSSNRNKSHSKGNTILESLSTRTINSIARVNKYLRRSTGKISPKNLIIGFMIMVSRHRNTYSDWATEIGILENTTISKQSLFERMNPQTENFIKSLVEKQLSEKIRPIKTKKMKRELKFFKNLMIDDSTMVKLPDELADYYPGNVTAGKKRSQAKIHALYNLTENKFSFLHVRSYCDSDGRLSSNVLPYLQKGDLCIRDLGFAVLDVFDELHKKGVYFISRKMFCAKVFEIESGTEINILRELKKRGFIDREVTIGSKHQIKVRLVAIPIPKEQAEERRRKARNDRNRRVNHAPEYYQLLGYAIYITNIPLEKCNSEKIQEFYKLRWQIEIIFKSWKSCFSLEKLIHRQCKNIIRVNCIIYLMLLYIYLFHVIWWNEYERNNGQCNKNNHLSIIKLGHFYRQHFTEILSGKLNKRIIDLIKASCTYEKRKDRENAKQLQYKLAA